MIHLLSVPVLLILLSIQITISSKFLFLNGFADVTLVWLIAWVIQTRVKKSWVWFAVAAMMAAFVSAVPWYAIFVSYSVIFLLGYFMKKRLWQSPILSFFMALILGSACYYLIQFLVLKIIGNNILWIDAVQRIIIPSTILNLVIGFPLYLIVRDFSSMIFKDFENE